MSIGLKIKELAEGKKLSIPELAKRIGRSKQSVYEIIEKEDINTSLLRQFAEVFSVPMSYFFDEGQENIDTSKKSEKAVHKASLSSQPGEGIPLIPFAAMAGMLCGEFTAYEYDCERYIIPMFANADFLMPISGDSMTPTYKSGDVVACKYVPLSDLFFQWNKVYIISTNQGALVKRVKPAEDKQHIRLISDNSCYDPVEMPISYIHGIALVVGLVRLE